MPTPGATRPGYVPPPHADGPRLLAAATASVRSVSPTARASGLFAGLTLVLDVGPLFPAAKTGTIPAARSARRSSWNSRSHPAVVIDQELLTTSGASGVLGLPSGSSSHWKPWWTTADVD